MFIKNITIDDRGALLLEILVVIGVLAIIVSFGSQLFLTSARSNKWARERNVALGLAEEVLEGVRGVASEDWLNIYKPPNGSGDSAADKGSSHHYYLQATGTKWVVLSGDETVTMDGMNYTRYFVIENTSRGAADGNIESAYTSADDDPSTQKITINISWSGAEPLSMVQYLTRWRNKVCVQSNWSAGAVAGTSSCAGEGYGSIDTNIDVGTAGSIKLKAQ
jgi:type II secretory pathway pseudopilin PulG